MKIITNQLDTKGFAIIDDFLPLDVTEKLIKIYNENVEWKRQEQTREDEEYKAKFWRWDYEKGAPDIEAIYKEHFKPSIEKHLNTEIIEYEISCMKMDKGDYYRAHLDGW